MHRTISRNPAKAARDALTMLYRHLRSSDTHPVPTLQTFYPVKVETLLQLLGWTQKGVGSRGEGAGYMGLGQRVHGFMDFSTKEVTLAATDRPEVRRFSLAHEIGHILLHEAPCPNQTPRLARSSSRRKPLRTPSQRPEIEANRFASELLMPEKPVRQRFHEIFHTSQILASSSHARDLASDLLKKPLFQPLQPVQLAQLLAAFQATDHSTSLASFFGVSAEAMGYRFRELEIIVR